MTDQNGAERSTATEELRRMLDERGVEWTDGGMFHRTHWVIDGIHYVAFEQSGKLYLQSSMGPLTPAQAIAATLGAGTCKVDVLNTGDWLVTNAASTSCTVKPAVTSSGTFSTTRTAACG